MPFGDGRVDCTSPFVLSVIRPLIFAGAPLSCLGSRLRAPCQENGANSIPHNNVTSKGECLLPAAVASTAPPWYENQGGLAMICGCTAMVLLPRPGHVQAPP